MDGLRIAAEPDQVILALRQEVLLLVRQQLASPDTSGAAEHVAAISCLAGASFVSAFLLPASCLESFMWPEIQASHVNIAAGLWVRTRCELHHAHQCSVNASQKQRRI
jgi:hypothetical protein